jgi:hypothetical protein
LSVDIAGFYHDPPLFVGEKPVDIPDGGGTPHVHFDRFSREVMRTTLAGGLEISVTVDGEFMFDFTALPDCVYPHGDMRDFLAMADIRGRRIRFMNAYLAFFYTREILAENRSYERMLVTMNLMFSKGTGMNPMVGPMMASRYPQYSPSAATMLAVARMGPISVEVAADAASDLSALIEAHGSDGVMLADLYLRAGHAYQEHNHSFSLVSFWTIIERLINNLWKKLQGDHESRDGEVFIDGKRRKRLEDGRTYTAAVMTEILSLFNYIPKDLYDDLSAVRKLRNDWMHDLQQINAKEAMRANSVCERLLRQVMGVTLRGPGGLMLRGM